MKLKDMFGQYFKEHEKKDRNEPGQAQQPVEGEQKPIHDQEVVPFTGTPPGSEVKVVPEMLEKVTPGSKGVH